MIYEPEQLAISYRRDFGGIWWPDYDHKPEKCHALVRKGLVDMDHAVKVCTHRRIVVQAGGHAGLWPLRLAKSFDHVLTFEPEQMLYECMLRNTQNEPRVHALPYALSDKDGEVLLRPSVSAGSWRVDEVEGTVLVKSVTLDTYYALHDIGHLDALFLDVEGYEVSVLHGARATIARCRPVIQVEELPRSRDAIVAHMASIGYRFAKYQGKDAVYVAS